MPEEWSDAYFGAGAVEPQPCPDGEVPAPAETPPVPQQLGQRDVPSDGEAAADLAALGAGSYMSYAESQLAYLTAPAPGQPDPLADQIGQAHELVNSVTSKITAHLTEQLDKAAEVISSCHDNICGAAHLVMDEAEKHIQRCQKKIDEKLVFTLAMVYNLLARFGVQYPTDEELQQRLGRAQLDSPSEETDTGYQTGQTSAIQGQQTELASLRSPGQPPSVAVARGFSSANVPQTAVPGAEMARQSFAGMECVPVVLCESQGDLAPPSQFPPEDDPIFPLSPEREAATGEVN